MNTLFHFRIFIAALSSDADEPNPENIIKQVLEQNQDLKAALTANPDDDSDYVCWKFLCIDRIE